MMLFDNVDLFEQHDQQKEKDMEYYNRFGTDRCKLGHKDECLEEMGEEDGNII